MSKLSGKNVVLDLNALQRICNECMSAINDQQDEMIQQSMRKVCDSCTEVRERLPRLKALNESAGTCVEFPEECCA